MDIRQLAPRFFVSPQIAPGEMDELAAAGITRIICNRPDAEVPPGYHADVMRKAADAAGIQFDELPLTHTSMVPEVIAKYRALAAGPEDVILAYCASGTRSTIAWALGQAGEAEPEEIIKAAGAAGYDLAHMHHVLAQPFV